MNRRVLFLFSKPRGQIVSEVERGSAPDDLLYGMRRLDEWGYEGYCSDRGFPARRRWPSAVGLLASRFTGLGFNFRQALFLRREMRRPHCVFATSDSAGLPVALLRKWGCVGRPLVYGTVGLLQSVSERPTRWVWKRYGEILAVVSGVVAYGKGEAELLCRRLGLDRTPTAFLPFGTDVDFFRRAETPDGAFVLAFGRDEQRDWNLFLQAADSLRDTEFVLVTTRSRMKGMAVPGNVRILCDISYLRLRDLLARATLVTIPVRENLYSGGTISLLEAMAMEKAVVVSRTQAICEGYGLEHGENVYLVPPGDVDALKRGISSLWKDGPCRARMGKEARQTLLRLELTSQGLAKRIAAFFDEVLSS